jgi:hypothetical protein
MTRKTVRAEAAILAILAVIGWLDVSAEITAINFRRLAFPADRAAFHFLRHSFPQCWPCWQRWSWKE